MAATPWTYDHSTAEWSKRYSPDVFAACHLRGGAWHGSLVVGAARQTTGQWRDSKTAKRELDRAYREHVARVTK